MTMLYFENPLILYITPIIVLLAYIVSRIGRRFYLKTYRGSHPLIDFIDLRESFKHPWYIDALITATIFLILLSIANPYYTYTVIETKETKNVGTLSFNVKPPVVLVLDNSGSMQGEKIEAAKQALLTFTDRIDGKLDIGLVVFNDHIDVSIPPTNDIEEIKNTIKGIEAGGGTMYTYSLKLVYDWLKPYREFNVSVFVVFASDGLPADAKELDLILEKYREAKIPIYGIFIGYQNEGYDMIKYMAEETNGEAYQVTDINELVEKYEEIASKILNKTDINVTVKIVQTIERTEKASIGVYLELASLVLLIITYYIRHRHYGITF